MRLARSFCGVVFSLWFAGCASTPAPIGNEEGRGTERAPAAVVCPGYAFEKADYDFDPYRPKYSAAEIGAARIHLDVGEKDLYRGTNQASKQFDAASAIRAMLGDSTAYVGSFFFDDVIRYLGGEKPIHPKFNETVAAIQPSLQAAEKCVRAANGGKKLKQRFARDLTTKYFWSIQNSGPGRVSATFLDYDSKERQDWAPSLVFGTVVSEVADYYGGKTLVYREPRAFSLALYNLDLGNASKTVPADVGETIVPGFLPPTAIRGFDWKTGDRVGGTAAEYDKKLDYSIRRAVVDGVSLALVFDTSGQDVLLENADGSYVGGSVRGILWSIENKTDHPGMPSPNGFVPKLMGAFRTCAAKACPLPAGLKKRFVASARAIPEGLAKNVAGLAIGGVPVRFVPADWVLPDPLIEIRSATYGLGLPGIKKGNVTAEARKSPCQGAGECTYKVLVKFVGDPAPGKPKAFELVWSCRNRPKDVKTETLPAPAEGKILKLKCAP